MTASFTDCDSLGLAKGDSAEDDLAFGRGTDGQFERGEDRVEKALR